MKKNYLFIVLYSVFIGSLLAQENLKPLNIKANSFTTITFFFPSGIETVIPPAANYNFEYEKGNTLGTLQARKGNSGNLTVITVSGEVYSFLLEYSEKIETFTYLITPNQAVGNVNNNLANDSQSKMIEQEVTLTQDSQETANESLDPEIKVLPSLKVNEDNSNENFNPNKSFDPDEYTIEESNYSEEESDLYNSDPEEYYRIFCENNYLQKTIYKRSFRQNKKIIVRLNNILIDHDEVYFMLNLENTSKKEYAVNGLSFFIKDKNNKNPKIIEPVYTFNLQKLIDPESDNEIVYVFKRFPVSNDETLEIVLDEKNGTRMVILPLDYKYLN